MDNSLLVSLEVSSCNAENQILKFAIYYSLKGPKIVPMTEPGKIAIPTSDLTKFAWGKETLNAAICQLLRTSGLSSGSIFLASYFHATFLGKGLAVYTTLYLYLMRCKFDDYGLKCTQRRVYIK